MARYSITQWYRNTCETCGKEFHTNKPGHTCSNACRQSLYRKRKQAEQFAKEQMQDMFKDIYLGGINDKHPF